MSAPSQIVNTLESAAEKTAFQQEVLEACRPAYPLQADGKILFPFKRTFFIAYKA